MATQRVFWLPQRTSINDLVVLEEPVPEPLQNEVLIKVRSVSLNYRDAAIATSQYHFPVKDNVVPGSAIAGDVVAVGNKVDDFVKGNKVIAAFDIATLAGPILNCGHGLGGPVDSGLREYIALPSSVLVKAPQATSLTYPQLAALVCTGTAAWNALYGNLPLLPGQTVVFLGRRFPENSSTQAKLQ